MATSRSRSDAPWSRSQRSNSPAEATGVAPEEVRFAGRELYLHCVNGVGRSTIGKVPIEKLLKTVGTARNWNTVTKLLDVAESLAAR